MPEPLDEKALYSEGLAVLERNLGPVETLRFLAMLSRHPFDYQQWRRQHFEGMPLNKIVEQSRTLSL